MSTYEYYDLFLKAQNTGKYNMFVFDMVDSKKMDSISRKVNQEKMMQLMLNMYNDLKEIEVKTGRKILVMEDGIVPYEDRIKVMYKFGFLHEPFIYGDMFGFTVYRNSIMKDEIMTIYENYKIKLDIDFDFHIMDGYYETNKYQDGNKEFFRGYCIDILSNYHKNYNEQVIEESDIKKK